MSHDERLLDVADADPEAALLWPWLLTAFDDWGRSHAEPRRLKVQVFPGNELVDHRVIARTLALLHDNALISVWEHEERAYMAVDNDTWFKWQTHIRKEKRDDDSGSKLPKPPDQVFLVDDGRSARFPAHLRALARDRTPSPSPSPSPSSSSREFDLFNLARAKKDAAAQKESGIEVRNVEGLARSIAARDDFLAESHRLFAHRDCVRCGGKGSYDSEYAPGGGIRPIECREGVGV